ncbi:MAG: SDR family oxidoreductase [Bacteroidales bacterium]
MMNSNKYLFVTGASSGIGREMAVKFSENYPVIVSGKNKERLEQTLQMCSNKHQHLIWQYDLENIENIESDLSAFLLDNQVAVSYFIHCAGYMKVYPLKMLTAALFSTMFKVNVLSAAMMVKVLTNKKTNNKALKNAVFISSNISNFGAKAFSAYSSSKAALDGLMRSLAVELAPAVRINSVLPGAVQTAMTAHMYEDEQLINRMKADYPLGLGNVEDIYQAVRFLLSDEARWITGQQLTVDGGRTINITG